MTRIALVDHDRNALSSLSDLLTREGFKVDSFTDPLRALNEFRRKVPDVAVMDTRFPRLDGLELMRRVHENADVPVVFLTDEADEADEIMGLRLGADEYLRKSNSPRVMLERLRACVRRSQRSASERQDKLQPVIQRGPLEIDLNCRDVKWRGQTVPATQTELRILHLLADKPGFVRSRDQIMAHIYDESVYVEDRTIDSHLKRIRKKMRDIDPDFEGIETLYGAGYRFVLPKV